MISAKIIAHSKHFNKDSEVITYELVLHRHLLAQFNTHRKLSRLSASSRAVPISKNIEYIKNNTAKPIYWRKNCPGMSAMEQFPIEKWEEFDNKWYEARDYMIEVARYYEKEGVHKEIVNRLLETFAYQKIVATATDWDNFFWLRYDSEASPEIKLLAELMLKEYVKSKPKILYEGEWHLPYITSIRNSHGELNYFDSNGEQLSLENALKISSSCCAQTSYRNHNDTLEKALDIFDKLNLDNEDGTNKPHSSAVENQATPIVKLAQGITHITMDGELCSGNFTNWIQYRHLFKNESCKKYPYEKLNFSV